MTKRFRRLLQWQPSQLWRFVRRLSTRVPATVGRHAAAQIEMALKYWAIDTLCAPADNKKWTLAAAQRAPAFAPTGVGHRPNHIVPAS